MVVLWLVVTYATICAEEETSYNQLTLLFLKKFLPEVQGMCVKLPAIAKPFFLKQFACYNIK